MKQATLVLADGTLFKGRSFGFEGETAGEVVFNTSLTGYQEILTDPSYCRQIVVFTYPMIGNYGVNAEDVESEKIQVSGLIVKEYCPIPSNWRSKESLGEYLRRHKIVGVEGLPTREIVRRIRDTGAQPGILATGEVDVAALKKRAAALPSMSGMELATQVTCSKPYLLKSSAARKHFVIAYDFGIKRNILRHLQARGCDVKVVPALTPAQEVLKEKPDGIVLSNGPGDPAACSEIVAEIGRLVGSVPILGICLGHQLLSLAFGAQTFKLKFGHRGANQPVKDLETGRVLITAQNHGFAVASEKFPSELEITQTNLNDGTVEGFRHKKYPIISVQYHPEAAPGPHDAENIFDQFCEMMSYAKENGHSKNTGDRVGSHSNRPGM